MALVLLLNDWVKKKNMDLVAFTVDHQFRPESGDEAIQVNKWLTKRGTMWS